MKYFIEAMEDLVVYEESKIIVIIMISLSINRSIDKAVVMHIILVKTEEHMTTHFYFLKNMKQLISQ